MHFSSTPHLLHSKVALHLGSELLSQQRRKATVEHVTAHQSSHLSDIHPFSLFKWTKYITPDQAAVQGLLGRDTYVPSEWVWHLEALLLQKFWRALKECLSLMSSKNTSSRISWHSDMGHQAYGARDTEECFSRNSTVLMARNYVQVCRLSQPETDILTDW